MIFQSLKMAWSAITSNKMRSFLTMLGIIIGVMSLVVLVSIANSATTSVTDDIQYWNKSFNGPHCGQQRKSIEVIRTFQFYG